eukprot:gene19658-biopygen6228
MNEIDWEEHILPEIMDVVNDSIVKVRSPEEGVGEECIEIWFGGCAPKPYLDALLPSALQPTPFPKIPLNCYVCREAPSQSHPEDVRHMICVC